MNVSQKIIIYTHHCHRTAGLPAQVLRHLLHNGGDGEGCRAAGGRHDGGDGVDGDGSGVGGIGHHLHRLLHHLLHQFVESCRNVEGRTDGGVVRSIDHGGDDEDRCVLAHPLVDGREVVTCRHLLRVPLNPLPQSHHVNFDVMV